MCIMVRLALSIHGIRGDRRRDGKQDIITSVQQAGLAGWPPVLGRPFKSMFCKWPKKLPVSEGVYVITRPNCVGTKAMYEVMGDYGVEFTWVLALCGGKEVVEQDALSPADRIIVATLKRPFDTELLTPSGVMVNQSLMVVRHVYVRGPDVWREFAESCRLAAIHQRR